MQIFLFENSAKTTFFYRFSLSFQMMFYYSRIQLLIYFNWILPLYNLVYKSIYVH